MPTGQETDESNPKEDADRWGWFRIIYHFAGGDSAKFDVIEKQELILALNTLSYEQDKNREEKQRLNLNNV